MLNHNDKYHPIAAASLSGKSTVCERWCIRVSWEDGDRARPSQWQFNTAFAIIKEQARQHVPMCVESTPRLTLAAEV